MKRLWIVFVVLMFGCSPTTGTPDGASQNEAAQEATTTEEKPTTGEASQEPNVADEGKEGGGTEPASEPASEPGPESTTEPATEPASEPSTPDAGEPTPEDSSGPEDGPEAGPEAGPESEPTPESTPEPVKESEPMTCTERAQKAVADVEAERVKHLTCAANTDCTNVGTSTDCQGACPKAVSTSGKTKVESLITQINQTYCKGYQADGCPYATPKCVANSPVCHQKTCMLMTCTERRTKASDDVRAIEQQNLSCTVDSDCVLYWAGTKCAGACQRVVNKTGEPLVKAAITDVNNGICETYQKDQCPYATPSCLPAQAKCTNSVCVMVTGTP